MDNYERVVWAVGEHAADELKKAGLIASDKIEFEDLDGPNPALKPTHWRLDAEVLPTTIQDTQNRGRIDYNVGSQFYGLLWPHQQRWRKKSITKASKVGKQKATVLHNARKLRDYGLGVRVTACAMVDLYEEPI